MKPNDLRFLKYRGLLVYLASSVIVRRALRRPFLLSAMMGTLGQTWRTSSLPDAGGMFSKESGESMLKHMRITSVAVCDNDRNRSSSQFSLASSGIVRGTFRRPFLLPAYDDGHVAADVVHFQPPRHQRDVLQGVRREDAEARDHHVWVRQWSQPAVVLLPRIFPGSKFYLDLDGCGVVLE
ncbi:hypothetical protein MTO96_013121 [Rhipicephalus appendiculatus]